MEENVAFTPQYSPNKLAFKSALVYTVYFLVLIYVFKMLGIDQNNPNMTTVEKIVSSTLSYVPFILAILYVQTNFKKELGGYITFGKAFSAGFKVAAYSGLFVGFVLIVYYKFLDREAFEALIDLALQKAGSDAQQVKGIEMTRPYMVFFIGFGGAVSYTLTGLVVSLISAAIIKRDRPLYEVNELQP